MVEQLTLNQRVQGSNPCTPTNLLKYSGRSLVLPSVFDYVKSDFERKVLELHFGQLKLARPFMALPGVPGDRQKVLQDAFEAAMSDPELLEDAKNAGIDIDPVSGPEAQKLLAHFGDFPTPVIEKAKENIGR